MALNKYMHPRNIYRTPPDFGNLSKKYSEFSSIAKMDVSGKISINFKDPQSLRILTKCLLKEDFNLDVNIPNNRLVPTLPLRLNYILWIEDLMTATNQCYSKVHGIDIGTGACAIYPLLAASKNKWYMLATEVDSESLKIAQDHIQQNTLQNFIEVKDNKGPTLLENLFSGESSQNYQFCMCNPPFYSTLQELYESRSPARLPPKNGFTGSPQELITEGGELKFCRTLIKESKNCRNNVMIFTTMVGHKYNLLELLQDLKADGIRHTHTEFCQGRVTRWGLAWTFQDYDIYKLVPPREKSRKKNTPVVIKLPQLCYGSNNVEEAYNKIRLIFNDLEMEQTVASRQVPHTFVWNILAKKNTWSNQRRKRRFIKRMENLENKKQKLELDSKLCESNDQEKTDLNHSLISSCFEMNQSNLTSEVSELNSCSKLTSTTGSYEPEILVESFVKLYKKQDVVHLEMELNGGSGGKESLHQIVQYIKNNYQ